MLTSQPVSSSIENVWLWLLKIASGIVIFFILGAHLVVNHFIAEGGLLSFADVVAYYQNPLIPLMEGLFLVFVITHSLLGVRGILLDLDPPPGVRRVVDVVLILIGLTATGYGIGVLLAVMGYG